MPFSKSLTAKMWKPRRQKGPWQQPYGSPGPLGLKLRAPPPYGRKHNRMENIRKYRENDDGNS